jgi:hypothetical protein
LDKEFVKWPSIPRIENEKYFFTEKIDGTNACVVIKPDGQYYCQSRTRIITPEDDNFGFAKWVKDNEKEILKLGEGRWYGEWWGSGIQRRYDQTTKRFSLFYYAGDIPTPLVERVPEIPVSTVEECKEYLYINGSLVAPGFMKPEGAVMYSSLTRTRYKIILDK